jgi:hypothetical protein
MLRSISSKKNRELISQKGSKKNQDDFNSDVLQFQKKYEIDEIALGKKWKNDPNNPLAIAEKQAHHEMMETRMLEFGLYEEVSQEDLNNEAFDGIREHLDSNPELREMVKNYLMQ